MSSMTPDGVRNTLRLCISRLNERFPGMQAIAMPEDDMKKTQILPHIITIPHLLFMCEEIVKFDDTEKTMRWLGFIQGVMWAEGLASINEMRNWNRPNFKK